MIRIDHWWSSKANPPALPSSLLHALPPSAAMTNATSVIRRKFFQQAATLSHPKWEKLQRSVVALACCYHTQMDPSYLWSGPVSEHTYKTAFHPLRLPVLSVLCLGRFYSLGWIYDSHAAGGCESSAVWPSRCTPLLPVMFEQGPPSALWWFNGGRSLFSRAWLTSPRHRD